MRLWGRHTVNDWSRTGLVPALLCLLAGCGGGSQSPDPVVADFPIAYVKRPIPEDLRQSDVRQVLRFEAGGDLYLRDRASIVAPERNITGHITGGQGDVRDLEVSYDGTKLLFSLHLPEIENADPEDQPTWNVWEYDIPSGALRRLIELDIKAEDGQDLGPHYLPDGRIVFSSSRQERARAILRDEGKDGFTAFAEDRQEPALSLHVMDADGGDIQQISFNQSHDLDPTVLPTGEILFSRWDNAGGRNTIQLYRIRADGTGLEHFYGAHSHNTGTANSAVQFMQPRLMDDGRVLTLLMPFAGTYLAGKPTFIDTATYSDNTTALYPNTGMLTGPAQTAVLGLDVETRVNEISRGGRFSSVYPLYDGSNRLLASWSPCRLQEGAQVASCSDDKLANENAVEATPAFGLWIFDLGTNTQLPIVPALAGLMITEAVVARPRPAPGLSLSGAIDLNLAEAGVGVLNIKSVYDLDGTAERIDNTTVDIELLRDPAQATAAQRPARYLRVVKAVSIPDRDLIELPNSAFGRSAQQLMREIIGYAPIEPDGSVMLKVPANTALAVEVLDADGRRIGARHLNWLQVRPGETVTCSGCHTHNALGSHGRRGEWPALNTGAPATGVAFANTLSTLQADAGETMAELRARQYPLICASVPVAAEFAAFCARDPLAPNPDLVFDDVWTDPVAAARPVDASFAARYADLAAAQPDSLGPLPVADACLDGAGTGWTPGCRIVIHYPTHIHPLWEVDRGADTCTGCHTTGPAELRQIPAGQLDLSGEPSIDQTDHFISYRELLFPDNEQELVDGALQDVLVPADPPFEVDENGELVLDENDQPIPVPRPPVNVTVQPSMSVNGARASARFVDLFAAGGTHAGRLSAAELKLISEWLDLGAQYYNDPFAVPQPD